MTQPAIRCVEFVEMVTDWYEGALADAVASEVEEHIALCPDCTDYVEQLRATLTMLEGAVEEAPPPAAREALLAEFRRRRSS